jgi:hypothetical protein
MNASDYMLDRDTALHLIGDASAAMSEAISAVRAIMAMPPHDLPDEVKTELLHSLKRWHDGAGVTLQMIGVVWLRVATPNTQEECRPAIEGGEA